MPRPPDVRTLLRRALRLRCPACGVGPVFRRGFRRAESCRACLRRLDRDEGHWLGGSEVVMFVAFGGGAAIAVPALLLFDPPPGVLHLLGVAHLAASLALLKPSRALFLAFDYYLDPSDAPAAPEGGPGPRGDDTPEPRPRPGGGRRVRRRRAASVPQP